MDAFFEVYNRLGYGFLEAVYARALEVELRQRGLQLAREVRMEARYKGVAVGHFRADFVVEGNLIVELKAASRLCAADRAQLHNYLRVGGFSRGLLLNFGVEPSFWRLVLPSGA